MYIGENTVVLAARGQVQLFQGTLKKLAGGDQPPVVREVNIDSANPAPEITQPLSEGKVVVVDGGRALFQILIQLGPSLTDEMASRLYIVVDNPVGNEDPKVIQGNLKILAEAKEQVDEATRVPNYFG